MPGVRCIIPAVALAIGACGLDGVVGIDSRSQSISVRIGQEIEVTLGNVGAAIYESPPTMFPSDVVSYLGVDVIPPYNPGGPTQRFRFKAVNSGRAVITFRRTLTGAVVSTVMDTLEVR
jgi:hypothetical protein